MVIRIKNFMAYAAAMPMALLAALPAGAQSVDNAADAFQRERKYSVDNPLPPPSFYYGAKKAMEYADRLSGSADVRAFVDATGSAVHIGGWYEYVTKQGKKPDGMAARLKSWIQAQLGHDAGDVNRPRIDIDLLWTGVEDDSEDLVSVKNRVSAHMRATPTVGSHFPAERVKNFTSAIGSYTDTSLIIAESHADQRVIEELEILQKGAKPKIELNPMPQWYGQFNPIFKEPCGCWETDNCNGEKITGNLCCNRAARKIMSAANVTPETNITIVSSTNGCSTTYSTHGLTGIISSFNDAIKIIDISLKEHNKPVMIGVQRPYLVTNQWVYKCGSTQNNPRSTNHFVVIVGKDYDEEKKLWFYRFYEVATGNQSKGTSTDNKLWIYTNERLIKGNVSTQEDFQNYYIVTSIRKNQGKTYN